MTIATTTPPTYAADFKPCHFYFFKNAPDVASESKVSMAPFSIVILCFTMNFIKNLVLRSYYYSNFN